MKNPPNDGGVATSQCTVVLSSPARTIEGETIICAPAGAGTKLALMPASTPCRHLVFPARSHASQICWVAILLTACCAQLSVPQSDISLQFSCSDVKDRASAFPKRAWNEKIRSNTTLRSLRLRGSGIDADSDDTMTSAAAGTNDIKHYVPSVIQNDVDSARAGDSSLPSAMESPEYLRKMYLNLTRNTAVDSPYAGKLEGRAGTDAELLARRFRRSATLRRHGDESAASLQDAEPEGIATGSDRVPRHRRQDRRSTANKKEETFALDLETMLEHPSMLEDSQEVTSSERRLDEMLREMKEGMGTATEADFEEIAARQQRALRAESRASFDEVWAELHQSSKASVRLLHSNEAANAMDDDGACFTFPDAASLYEGQGREISAGNGRFEWSDRAYFADGTAHVRAQRDSCFTGRWDMGEGTNGTVSGVRVDWIPEGGETLWDKEIWQSGMIVWGGPWLMAECELRCQGGTMLSVSVLGGCWLRGCSVGGMGDVTQQASNGVVVQMRARCVMEGCVVERTGFASGVGVRVHDRGSALLRGCVFERNDYAAGVDMGGAVELEGCRLLWQQWAAFWVGEDAEAGAIALRRSTVRGRLFADTAIQSRNDTAWEAFRANKPLTEGQELRQPGHEGLYYLRHVVYRRPGRWESEENELLEVSEEFESDPAECPQWALEEATAVTLNETDWTVWRLPDDSDEEKLYEAATMDQERKEMGLRAAVFEEDGEVIEGCLNYTRRELQGEKVMVTDLQIRNLQHLIAMQYDHRRLVEREHERQVPRWYRQEQEGRLPRWWTKYSMDNMFKRESAHWAEQVTEWDTPFRKIPPPGTNGSELYRYSVEELLYEDHDPNPAADEELVTARDMDIKTRSPLCPWPLDGDLVRQKKLEKRLGLPWDHLDNGRGAAGIRLWMEQKEREILGATRQQIWEASELPGQSAWSWPPLRRPECQNSEPNLPPPPTSSDSESDFEARRGGLPTQYYDTPLDEVGSDGGCQSLGEPQSVVLVGTSATSAVEAEGESESWVPRPKGRRAARRGVAGSRAP